jgi:hypothetical protein
MNSVPYEIIAAPFTLYLAPPATPFPAVDEDPSAPWVKVGTSGPLDMFPDGVTVDHSQTPVVFRSGGGTGPRKVFRSEEDFKIKLKLADMTLEQYALALNSNHITETPAGPGVAGQKSVGLTRGFNMATMALLARGAVSPYMEGGAEQYEVPLVQQTSNPSVVYKAGEPAGLDLEFTAIEDPSATDDAEKFGRLVVQTDVAES